MEGHLTGRNLSCQWLRPLRYGGERLGVDGKFLAGHSQCPLLLLRIKSRRRPENHQRRLTPLFTSVLPPLPPSCPLSTGSRRKHQPPGVPLHLAAETPVIILLLTQISQTSAFSLATSRMLVRAFACSSTGYQTPAEMVRSAEEAPARPRSISIANAAVA